MVHINEASNDDDLDACRALIGDFIGWHRLRHAADAELLDEYYDPAYIEAEIAGLPGAYSPPGGRLLLARVDGQPAGCVALRRMDARECEMKRMYIEPRFRGRGVAMALGQAIIREARAAGYSKMWLDTSVRQPEAQALYGKLGFRRSQPYYEVSPALCEWLVFFERSLLDD